MFDLILEYLKNEYSIISRYIISREEAIASIIILYIFVTSPPF
jgi:hypothetical protein